MEQNHIRKLATAHMVSVRPAQIEYLLGAECYAHYRNCC